MIPDDTFTGPGDEVWPQIGRGGHLRNAKGQALVIPPGGGRARIALGGSDIDVFDVYDGPTIYGDQGSHVHLVTEWADTGRPVNDGLIDLGIDVGIDGPTTHLIYDSYLEFITGLGWTTELTECVVVNDLYSMPIASNIDKVMRTPNSLVVVDVKSGNKCERRGTVMQLAAYVDAMLHDPTTGERTPLGDINPQIAYVFHFALRGDQMWRARPVDVAVGRALLSKFFALRDDDTHLAAFGESIATPTPPSVVESPDGGDDRTAVASPPSKPDTATLDQLRAECRQWSPGDRLALAAFISMHDVDTDDPAAVDEAMRAVLSFADINIPSPNTDTAPSDTPIRPQVATEPDEGADAADAAVDAVRERYKRLDKPGRTWVDTIGTQARHAKLSFHMSADGGRRTVRRLRIMSALVALADGYDNDDAVRGCVANINADIADAMSFNLGQVVGHLNADEAARFDEIAHALTDGHAAMKFTPKPRVEATP